MGRDGLSMEPRHERLVREILRRHVADREVWAFGSRVTGRPRRYSDLDLVILGRTPLAPAARAELVEAFKESDLPFRVDVLEWARLEEPFRQVIRDDHAVVQRAEGAAPLRPRI
ncbi:MAG: nucleotidyltransferase family protein [Deferrisomatales bacterium]